MIRPSRKPELIEFKGVTLPVVSITLRTLLAEQLEKTATALFGSNDFFDGDAAVLELEHIDATEKPAPDWTAIRAVFRRHGLHIIGVRGASDALRASAEASGLAAINATRRPHRSAEPLAEIPKKTPEPTAPDRPATPPPSKPQTPTLIIDRPLRSGQQAYARHGDIVVLAAVNAGAEVIADGSIHVYAPLRGRALAGASGQTAARIFTTHFEAELVSIAGVYRTFESGIPDAFAQRPAQVQLAGSTDNDISQILIEPLTID